VEHIAPQSLKAWSGDLKRWMSTAESVERVINTLGNLTAATNRHNKSVGARALKQKQTRLAKEPPLGLNAGWRSKTKWTATEIEARGRLLAAKALAYWTA